MSRIRGQLVVLIAILTMPAHRALAQEKRPTVGEVGSITAPLARAVPRQDLLAYLEFHGLEAHADAWHKTAAYRLLNETKLGALLEELAVQAIDVYQANVSTKVRIKGIDAVDAAKAIARDGFVLAVSGKPRDRQRWIVVLRRGDRPEIKSVVEGLEAGRAGEADAKAEVGPVQKAGRTLHRFGRDGVWWVEKGALILTDGSKADEILEVLNGRQPSALDHPLRAPSGQGRGEFRARCVGFSRRGRSRAAFFRLDQPRPWRSQTPRATLGIRCGGSREHRRRGGSSPSLGCSCAARPADFRDWLASLDPRRCKWPDSDVDRPGQELRPG